MCMNVSQGCYTKLPKVKFQGFAAEKTIAFTEFILNGKLKPFCLPLNSEHRETFSELYGETSANTTCLQMV